MSPIITPDQLWLVIFFTKPCEDHYLLWKFTGPNYCWQDFVFEENLWSNFDTLNFFRDSLRGGVSSDFEFLNPMVPIFTHFFKSVEFLLAFHKVHCVQIGDNIGEAWLLLAIHKFRIYTMTSSTYQKSSTQCISLNIEKSNVTFGWIEPQFKRFCPLQEKLTT